LGSSSVQAGVGGYILPQAVAGYFSATPSEFQAVPEFVDYAETIIELFATKQKEGDRSECNFMLITKDAGFRMEKSMLIHPGLPAGWICKTSGRVRIEFTRSNSGVVINRR
jgi:hypothetical protein